MKYQKLIFSTLATAALVGAAFTPTTAFSCGGWFEPSCGSASDLQQRETEKVSANQNRMEQAVGLPNLQGSLERQNIKKRLETFSNENKISYIYLVSYGRVMSFYTIKGKVTSGNKRLTASQRQVDATGSCTNCSLVMESPELDGTYGSSSPYIFFWTTDNVYVQWSGDYMLVDQPLQLASQPELTREVK